METLQNQTGDTGKEQRDKRSVNRLLRFTLIAASALALVLLVLLATATSNTEYFARAYQWLFWITVGVTVGLFGLIIELLRRLLQRYRRGLFGTRLMARMAISFSLMMLLPVLLIYLVAVTFVGRSIESWFDVPLERALESGLTMGRATLEAMRSDVRAKAKAMAFVLSEAPRRQRADQLISLSAQNVVPDAALFNGNGQVLASSGDRFAPLVPDLPNAEQLRRVRESREYAEFETDADQEGSLKLRIIVIVDGIGQNLGQVQYLQLIEPVPRALAESAEAIEMGRAGYQQLLESRAGLKQLFRVTLTLIFLLTAFAAIAAAFLLSGWLTGPLSMLAA
ncbi:MAG: PAS domain-containing sensor histidine kinase, partial [Burkholderiaceae bacterium]